MDRSRANKNLRPEAAREGVDDEPYKGVGTELRAARVAAGHELEDVARSLRIRLAHLQAIEAGRYSDLPGPVYAIGFLRSYAEFLNFDGRAAARIFREEAEGLRTTTKLIFPAPVPQGNLPRGALIIFCLLVAGTVFGAWHFRVEQNRIDVAAVPAVPERLATLVTSNSSLDDAVAEAKADTALDNRAEPVAAPPPAPAQSANLTSTILANATGEGVPSERTAPDTERARSAALDPAPDPAVGTASPVAAESSPPEPSPDATPEATPASPRAAVRPLPFPPLDRTILTPPPDAVALRDAPQPQPAPPPLSEQVSRAPSEPAYVPQSYGTGNKGGRVVLRAQSDSWVQIQGRNNELVMTRMLRAGDTYRVPNRRDLIMITGNAGGLEIVVDGRVMPSMGPPGTVRRDISLAADRLLELATSTD